MQANAFLVNHVWGFLLNLPKRESQPLTQSKCIACLGEAGIAEAGCLAEGFKSSDEALLDRSSK